MMLWIWEWCTEGRDFECEACRKEGLLNGARLFGHMKAYRRGGETISRSGKPCGQHVLLASLMVDQITLATTAGGSGELVSSHNP